jgi:hypothetical protein
MDPHEVSEALEHPGARNLLESAPSARLPRIRQLPASDPDRFLLERETDHRLHGGDRAEGEGAVVAS